VLLIGADSAAGTALQGVVARWGRHELDLINHGVSRWKSERQAKKAVRRAGAACVVDLRFTFQLAAGEALQSLEVARTHWLAKACERAGIVYLLLSSDRVFSGRLPHAYREQEAPDAETPPGLALVEAEQRAIDGCTGAMVLRSGPVFSSTGPGLLTETLGAIRARRVSTLDDVDEFCPVGAADLGRVVAGVLDQIDAGAEPAGIYHYASPDRTTRYGFGEAVVAAASQFMEMGGAVLERTPRDPEEGVRNWALDCRALRDTFAIKQQPWRTVISDTVRTAFLLQKGG
jgi:dTDP-4-dehydrorhamnose reductase